MIQQKLTKTKTKWSL